MRILYVGGDISWPLGFGAEIRKWNLLQGLLKVGRTDAVIFSSADDPVAHPAFEGCDRIIELPRRHHVPSKIQRTRYESTGGRGYLTLLTTLPFEYQSADLGTPRSIVKWKVKLSDYDLVWFMTGRATLVFDKIRGPATILDGDDFSYVRNLGILRNSPWYGAKIWNYLDLAKMWYRERAYLRRFSFVVRCSEEDRALHPAENVVVIPNGTTVPTKVCRKPERRLIFVGLLTYEPNRNAVEWFLSNVWPAVRQRVPDAAFDVIGLGPSKRIMDAHGKNGISVLGFIDDLLPYYERAAASVAPLFAGGGTRLKILESLGRAVPVVSTSVGAYGIIADATHGLERADSAHAFSEKCIEILANATGETQARAAVGRELMMRRYDWRAIQRDVGNLVHRAVTKRNVHTNDPRAGAVK